MKIYQIAFSAEAPNVRDCIWAKPVGEGFSIFLLDGGTWRPLASTNGINDDVAAKLKSKADKVTAAKANHIAVLTSTGNIKDSGKSISDVASNGMTYKAAINSNSDLPTNLTASDNGAQYVVATEGTYQKKKLAVGDFLVWNGTENKWDIYKK